jgi:predicted O-methyltransferase YrrM
MVTRESNALSRAVRVFREHGVRAVVAKSRSRLRLFCDAFIAARRMRSLPSSMQLEEILRIAHQFSVGEITIAPAQVPSEIEDLMRQVEAASPQRVLEIGTARGGTLFLFSRVAQVDARLASIDLPHGEFGGGYDWFRIPLLRAIPGKGQALKLIRADSHDPNTLGQVRQWFGRQMLDVLLIDGDHRYEGVERDFLMYGPLVRPNGVIAFHDIAPGSHDLVGGVPEFWQKVKESFATRELVSNWRQGGFGIGILDVPAEGLQLGASFGDAPGPNRSGESESLY